MAGNCRPEVLLALRALFKVQYCACLSCTNNPHICNVPGQFSKGHHGQRAPVQSSKIQTALH